MNVNMRKISRTGMENRMKYILPLNGRACCVEGRVIYPISAGTGNTGKQGKKTGAFIGRKLANLIVLLTEVRNGVILIT